MVTTADRALELDLFVYRNPDLVLVRREDDADLSDLVESLYELGEQVKFLCHPNCEFIAYWTSTRAVMVDFLA